MTITTKKEVNFFKIHKIYIQPSSTYINEPNVFPRLGEHVLYWEMK